MHVTLTTARLGSMIEVHNTEVLYQYHENKKKASSINSISQNLVQCVNTLTSASARLVLMSIKVVRQYSWSTTDVK